MKLLDKFHRFRTIFAAQTGHYPTVVPITKEEACEIASQIQNMRPTGPDDTRDRLLGMETYYTPYADAIRVRILEKSIVSPGVDKAPPCTLTKFEDWSTDDLRVLGALRLRLAAMIASDTSHVRVTFECDPWAGLKRALRLTKRFPIKQKSLVVEGTVLYPHLKVSFPADRHHIKLKIVD